MKKDVTSKATLEIGEGREDFIIKGEMKTKAYKFMALYKKRSRDKWKDFEKYLYLEPEEVILLEKISSNS